MRSDREYVSVLMEFSLFDGFLRYALLKNGDSAREQERGVDVFSSCHQEENSLS